MIVDLEEFYTDSDKAKAIEELLLTNLKCMEENSRLVDDDTEIE